MQSLAIWAIFLIKPYGEECMMCRTLFLVFTLIPGYFLLLLDSYYLRIAIVLLMAIAMIVYLVPWPFSLSGYLGKCLKKS